MRHIVYADSDSYPVALLVKNTAFNDREIRNAYVEPLVNAGVSRDQLVAMSLAYNENGKAPVGYIKEYLEELLPALDNVGTQTLYCADAAYFKVLTKQGKAEPNLGYVLPCKIEGYEHMSVVLGVNHKSLIYDPSNEPKLNLSLETLSQFCLGQYQPPGQDIIHFAEYPDDPERIRQLLKSLLEYPQLSCDIETFSLDHDKAGIGTVTLCWSQHEGIAFAVDYEELPEPINGLYGRQRDNRILKSYLKHFFEAYQGTMLWQNSPFDTKVFIYELWMTNGLDTRGLLEGLHVMHRRIHDTKIIAYLATNSCAGNSLSLKDLAHEFAGNYAQEEIKDIRKIPLPQLLEYNLVDGLCTWFVFNKYHPIMIQDDQQEIYETLMMPSQKVITQTELTGMPLNPKQVQRARAKLEAIVGEHEQTLASKPIVQQLEYRLTQEAWQKDYEDRKAKAKNPDKILPKPFDKFPRVTFNPNSGPQKQKLLYEEMELPVLDRTDTKLPATGGDTLEKLINHTQNQDQKDVIEALTGHADADKILTTFIPAFEQAIDKGQDVVWLHGSFNLGGTKSGRLSSSDPNLQNLPSGSTYGKLIKQCFQAPEGHIFCGADFNSLEDYISALTTKDPNKLRVYLEGYDGHALRAFNYWPEKFPWDELTPERSFEIKEDKELKKVRDASKTPTFALTYGGTFKTLMKNSGFDEEAAKAIEANYHELYKVSDEWVQARLDQAGIDGFVTLAFGLRLRTPLLAKTYRNKSSTPYEAQAEGRTAGNALGQSYGLLTNRACNEFMEKVWNSKYRFDVWPVAMIHDAIYLVIKDDVEVVEWVNRELIRSMEWQELPEIQHDTVKIGAALDLFYPDWSSELSLPNYASREEIRALCADFRTELNQQEKQAA